MAVGRRAPLVGAAAVIAGIAGQTIAVPPVVEQYGALADGRAVQRYSLTNRRGMVVRLLSLGGIITEISVA